MKHPNKLRSIYWVITVLILSISGILPVLFNILSFLVERPGRAVTRRQLAEHALPESGARYDRTVDSHMSRIRNKLGTEAAGHIKTVWGVGYKFEAAQASE